MWWRVRVTVADQPGVLASVADTCGRAGLNIESMQVLADGDAVIDEFVVSAPDGWSDVQVADLFEKAGGEAVSVHRVLDRSAPDVTTRYLDGVRAVLEEGRDVTEVLHELLLVAPPDVADYRGHDVLDLTRRSGDVLRISRAVPFSPVEKARAQALLSMVDDRAPSTPVLPPTLDRPIPLVRVATPADVESLEELHTRSSRETLLDRYQMPIQLPLSTRMARRLVAPDGGTALVVQVGLDLVAHSVIEPVDDRWTAQLLVEDAWQGRGLGALLVKRSAHAARDLGATHLTFVTAQSNDRLLRAVSSAGFMARIERHDAAVHVTVRLAR